MSGSGAPEPRLARLAVLVPGVVRRLLLDHTPEQLRGWSRSVEIVCIFADISGFTPLVQTLAARKKEGLEQLRGVVNRLYEALVSTAERFGGEVLRYAGDAMTVLFPREAGPAAAMADALRCAVALQEAMSEVQERLPRGLPPTGLKVGVGAGPLQMAIVGRQRMELAVDGAALQRAVVAEHALERGEIGVELRSLDLWGPEGARPPGQLRGEHVWVLERAGPFSGGSAAPGATVSPPPAAVFPLAERLAPFVLEPLYQRILSGSTDLLYEHRSLRVLFLRFDGLDCSRPEDLQRLDSYFADASEVVQRHGGFLTELDIGDKGSNLVGIFGAPVAIEAPWEAAGKSALEIVALSRRHGLSAKAGLACGPVFCGEIGAGSRLQYTVFGEAINRSARLMAQAGPEQVLVDPLLMEELGQDFVLEVLPPRQLKGFTVPVAVGRLLGRRNEDQSQAMEPMLGRTKELHRLEELWRQARAGHNATVALVGPPGIGKSRLVQELTARAAEDGGLVLRGRGEPEAQGVTLGAVLAALEPLIAAHAALAGGAGQKGPGESGQREGAGALATIVSRLLELAPGGAVSAESNPQVALQSALAAVDSLLAEQAQGRPVALVDEDLQWMDSASLELVQDQCHSPADRAMLLVLSSRESVPLKDFEGELMKLEAWSEAEVAQAALSFFGAELLDRELEQLLCRQSQGNPMMVHELCRHLVSSGRIEVSPYGQAHLTGAGGDELPSSLEALMLARLDQLPAPARHLLQVASCLGVELELGLLAHVAGLDEATTARLLETGQQNGLVSKLGSGAWSFSQPILRETVHGALPRADLRRLHGQVAEELSRLEAEGQPIEPARLAYHYHLAAKKKPAYRWSRLAAEAARRQGSMAETLVHLDRALELLEASALRAERQALTELLAERAGVHLILGNPGPATADAERLIRVARLRKDAKKEATGWMCLAQAREIQSLYPAARKAAGRALQIGRESEFKSVVASALQELAKFDFHEGLFDQAAQKLTEALDLVRGTADPLYEADIQVYFGRLCSRTGQLEKAQDHYKTAYQAFKAAGILNKELVVLRGLTVVGIFLRQLEQAHELGSRALVLSRQIGSRIEEATALQYLAEIAKLQGNIALAETCLRESIATFHRAGYVQGMATCTNNLAVLLHLQRRLDEAEIAYEQALDLTERSGDFPLLCIYVNNLAELHEDRGDLERARPEYERGLQMARQMRSSTEEAKALLGLARYAISDARVLDAQKLLVACREVAEASGQQEVLAEVAKLLKDLPTNVTRSSSSNEVQSLEP